MLSLLVIGVFLYTTSISLTSRSKLTEHAATSAYTRVEGVVLSKRRGADLSGVHVVLVRAGEKADHAQTDKHGKFVFDEVEPGAFSIVAEKAGVGSGKAAGMAEDGEAADVEIELK